jgi:hypothetical protein
MLAAEIARALQAQAERGAVASERHFDRFTGERLSLAIEQRFGGQRNPVPGALGLPGGVAGFALGKRPSTLSARLAWSRLHQIFAHNRRPCRHQWHCT